MLEKIDKFFSYLAELSSFLAELRAEITIKSSQEVKDRTLQYYIEPSSNTIPGECNTFGSERITTSEEIKKPSKRFNADLKENIKRQKNKAFTEIKKKENSDNMPFYKDLKYRVTQEGFHQFRYRRDGYNVSFSSKTYEVAKRKAYDFMDSIKAVIKVEADVIKRGNTFSAVFFTWAEVKKRHVEELTWRSYLSVYKNHLEPEFGNRSIKQILPMHLQPFFEELFAEKGKTCETAKFICNQVFNYAVANRFIPANPMMGVILERHIRTPGKALNDQEIQELKTSLRGLGDLGVAGLIILYSGVRGAEVCDLQFFWKEGYFRVHNAKLKKSQKARANILYRNVPIFQGLYEIKDLIEQSDGWRIPARKLSNDFSHFVSGCTAKDLRHTFTSRARMSGIDNELVNLWTGHMPGTNVTANIYTHYSLEYQIEQAKKMQKY